MPRFAAAWLLLALATAACAPLRAEAAEGQWQSYQRFSDWNFAYNSGVAALRQGAIEVASRRFRNAIDIARPLADEDPRPLARTYTDFALVLMQQGRAREAVPLAEWALKIREQRFGPESEQAAATVHTLALLASAQHEYVKAEALMTRAVLIWQKKLGPNALQTAIGLNDLATLCMLERKYPEAEALFRRVSDIPGTDLPENSPDRAVCLIGLASLYATEGRFDRVESTDGQLANLLDRMAPTAYPAIAAPLEGHIAQLRKLGRTTAADTLEATAKATRAGENMWTPPPRDRRRGSPVSGPRST